MPKKPDDAVSRRGFFNSVAAGVAGTAVTTTLPAAPSAAAPAEPDSPQAVKIALDVNGRTQRLEVEPRWTLLYVLRERLGMTATKSGCERGECGACTVLIDGVARYACMTLAVEAAGRKITTLEGLMHGEQLGAVQQAFVEEDAFQCGYCTPGQVMAVEALLRNNPEPSIEQIREGVSGNVCRCGAYAHIFKAARRASTMRQKEAKS